MKSIQTRLAGGLIISLIVFLIVQWLLIGTSIRYLSEAYMASRLEHDAESLLSALNFNARPPALDGNFVDAIYKQPFSGHYYRINTPGAEFRSRSLWDTNLPLAELDHGQSQLTHSTGPQDQRLLIFHSAYKKGKDVIQVSVAEDLTPILQDIETFQLQHTVISTVVLAILVLIQGYLVKRNLKPLEVVRRELENLEKGAIHQLTENVPVEILPLVRELNHQLDAIKKRLARSRNATGNLAHTLKTPLTLIARLANSDELQQFPDIRTKLLQHTATIQQSIERELKRARVAGSQIAGRQTLLLPEINNLVKTLSAMYREKDLSINVNVPHNAVCTIDRQDMLEILGNVLDNACKWARRAVGVTVEQNNRTSIIIEDDGPGEPEAMEKLVRRGTRADEQMAGHGLGLSIVTEIIDDYGGKLEFSQSAVLGGLRVCIHIPKR